MQSRTLKQYRARFRGGPHDTEWSEWRTRPSLTIRHERAIQEGPHTRISIEVLGTYVLRNGSYHWMPAEPKPKKETNAHS